MVVAATRTILAARTDRWSGPPETRLGAVNAHISSGRVRGLRRIMRTYVDVSFSSSGTDAVVVGRRLQALEGVSFIAGEHDLEFQWQDVEEFQARIRAIHKALAGTGATYRVHTMTDNPPFQEPTGWPPVLQQETPANPAFPKRKDPKGTTRIR